MALPNHLTQNNKSALLVVVMGVSGSGKTTLATEIAKHFDISFLDADSLHSEAAIKQMSQGIPLTDKLRAPWIERICRQIRQFEAQNISCVLAYSGLKQQHRDLIFKSCTHSLGILLNADQAVLEQRLQARRNHFMSPQLLSSQIAAMEPLSEKLTQLTLNLDLTDTVERHLLQSVRFINQYNLTNM